MRDFLKKISEFVFRKIKLKYISKRTEFSLDCFSLGKVFTAENGAFLNFAICNMFFRNTRNFYCKTFLERSGNENII